ncbi:MAG: hypothetical protein EA385_11595 [Salinarimonadaceae bacterium]|nr:MAG: hypothetical protein EA385_11595 [Salinarimonadaceae bacterium]
MLTGTKYRLIAAALLASIALVAPDREAEARAGSDPRTCMNLALEYAEALASRDTLDATLETHRANLLRLEALAEDVEAPPRELVNEAKAHARTREARDVDRDVRGALRLLDNARSIVAGWRGNYCPVARPDGGADLSGQPRCDAFSATFVDELRIERRTPEQTNEREQLTAERQTILKARITRDDRNDLLELWRLRSEGFDTLMRLERLQTLRGLALDLIEELRSTGCIPADPDKS